jgi:hypothetical protein
MNNKPKLYDSLLSLSIERNNNGKQEITRALLEKKLNTKKEKSKNMVYEKDFIWQVDLQYLRPNKSVYQYLFVAVDVSTRRCDAEPLRERTAIHATHALRAILDRHKISTQFPKIIYTDNGSEFQNEFTDYCNRNDIKHRTTQPGRKQQTAIVEYVNGLISYALNSYAYKLITQPKETPPRSLLDVNILADNILPRIVDTINEYVSTKYPKNPKQWFKFDFDRPPPDLKVGDIVYVKNPQMSRMRQRYGTHRYMSTPYQITDVFYPILKNQPYRFMTSFSDKLTFYRDELLKQSDYNDNSHVIQFD